MKHGYFIGNIPNIFRQTHMCKPTRESRNMKLKRYVRYTSQDTDRYSILVYIFIYPIYSLHVYVFGGPETIAILTHCGPSRSSRRHEEGCRLCGIRWFVFFQWFRLGIELGMIHMQDIDPIILHLMIVPIH